MRLEFPQALISLKLSKVFKPGGLCKTAGRGTWPPAAIGQRRGADQSQQVHGQTANTSYKRQSADKCLMSSLHRWLYCVQTRSEDA